MTEPTDRRHLTKLVRDAIASLRPRDKRATVADVARMMGHSSPRATLDVYRPGGGR